jgi:hypothetical protein
MAVAAEMTLAAGAYNFNFVGYLMNDKKTELTVTRDHAPLVYGKLASAYLSIKQRKGGAHDETVAEFEGYLENLRSGVLTPSQQIIRKDLTEVRGIYPETWVTDAVKFFTEELKNGTLPDFSPVQPSGKKVGF